MSQPAPVKMSGDDLGALLSRSWNLLLSQIGQYFLISLAAILPVTLISFVFGLLMVGSAMRFGLGDLTGAGLGLGGLVGLGLVSTIVVYLVSLLVGSMLMGALVHAANGQAATGRVSFQEAYRAAWAKVWTLVAVTLIVGLAVGLGSMLLVLPGLAAFFFLCLSPIAVVVDGVDIGTAIVRSCQYALRIPLEILVVGAIAFVATWILCLIPFVGWLAACLVVPWALIALTLAYKKVSV